MGNGAITTTLPTRSAHLLTIFPLFSRAFAPLPTVIAGSYRKARAYVSYVTWARAFRYEPAMVVCTVAAARSAPGLMAMRVGGLVLRVGGLVLRVGGLVLRVGGKPRCGQYNKRAAAVVSRGSQGYCSFRCM